MTLGIVGDFGISCAPMPNSIRVPLAQWAPDLPDFQWAPGMTDFAGTGSAVVRNVYPKTPISYGPVRSPAPVYGPITARCRGATSYLGSNGQVTLFAGDATTLYVIDPTDSTWRDISPTYTNAEAWRFTVFNGDVIAVDRNTLPQVSPLDGAHQFTNLPGNPPKGRYVASVKNAFVVLGDTSSPYDTSSWDDRLWWSAVGNHRDWPIPGTTEAAEKQSGSVRLFGPFGKIMGIATGLASADAFIFQRFGVQRMVYSGPPTTFSITPVEGVRGCLCPDSIVSYGGIAYYWSDDGIYAFDGQQSRPIGATRVNNAVYDELDKLQTSRVFGVADPKHHLIIWAYPSDQATDGNPDRLLIYNWDVSVDSFTICEVECEIIVRLLGIGYPDQELESILGYQSVSDIPYPLASDVWVQGISSLGIFNTNHQLAFMDASPLEATVDTPEMQLAPGQRQLLTAVRPLVDGSGTLPTVSIGSRERLQDDVTWRGPFTLNALGTCPMRVSGRYNRVSVTVPAGSDEWTAISGIEIDAVVQGRR